MGGKSLAFALQKLCFCKALIFSCLQNTKLSLPYNGKIEQLLLSEWAKKTGLSQISQPKVWHKGRVNTKVQFLLYYVIPSITDSNKAVCSVKSLFPNQKRFRYYGLYISVDSLQLLCNYP